MPSMTRNANPCLQLSSQSEENGPVTCGPFVDTLEGSDHQNMEELRPKAAKDGADM